MARMDQCTRSSYEKISFDDLKQPLLIVIDMVNGFIKEGALHDEAIMSIVPAITKMIPLVNETIFIADTHQENAQEFVSYPKHCLVGTSECELIDEFKGFHKRVIKKNSTNTFHSKEWHSFMEKELINYHDIILCGCCSDICVMQFALTLQTYINEMNLQDITLYVPVDMVETYHIDGIHDAKYCNTYSLANMAGNGIKVVSMISEDE
ncbi:MAG: isochorismatase family cysteine hydrolase [Erysipelotrichaceae bacterium]